MPSVIEIRHGSETRDFPLPDERPTTIGRVADNDITLEDPLVSRHHAKLDWAGGACTLTDLGSANGTRVDGRELSPREPERLSDGQAIEIGSFTLTFRAGGSTPTQSSGQGAPAAAPASPAQDDAYTFIVKPEPRLIITTPDSTREVPLEGDRASLGRTPENDIVVDASVVSRQHAELTRSGASWSIVDLNSTNGISYQGDRIPSRTLADGDVIWIADAVSITYRSLPFADLAEEEPPVERLELRGKREVTIGRHPNADITLNQPTVSRMHARLSLRDGHYTVEDLASSNGTYVNGEAVPPGQPRVLQPGDSIRIGPTRFDFSEEALQQTDESKDLRLDALHLNKPVDKGVNLLKDISLSVNPREFVAVVGVSGAGKSTLLDALNGFRPAGQGAVLINGTNLYRNFDAYRNDLGYVPQDDIIHKELPVEDALDYSAQLRLPSDTTAAERKQRVTEVMTTLGLNERAHIPIARLSGGQRKRVSIGAELLTKPGLFYLDEATSGLDPGTESQLMRLLRRLADVGHTILLITHATKNVMLCDQVIFLAKGGHLAFFGPPDEALKHFDVEDFDGIYEKLEEELSPEEWDARYKQSDAYRRCVAERLNTHYGAGAAAATTEIPPATAPAVAPKRPEKAPGKVSMIRQFWILSSRYLSIIRRDRTNLALMFAISPLLGAIDLLAWERNVLDPVDGNATTSMTMLFMGALIPFLVGALTSVREIVKESPVYRRERTVTLKIAPYLLSKVWVGFLFALYHATALFAMKLLAVDFQDATTADLAQFWATIALAAMSGVMWGLFISAVVPREEQAMVLVIAVVVIQMVFSGGLLPLSDLGAAGDVLGSITSTKWVFQGLVSSAHVLQGQCPPLPAMLDTCQLPGLYFYQTEPERRVVVDPILEKFGGVFGQDVYKTWAALGIIMGVLFVIIIGLQKRKDVV